MKIDRVNQVSGLTSRNSNTPRDARKQDSFRIQASLESDGNPDANDEEREAPNSCAARSKDANTVSYPMVASVDYIDNEDVGSAELPTYDSLDEFISRLKSASRLNLRF